MTIPKYKMELTKLKERKIRLRMEDKSDSKPPLLQNSLELNNLLVKPKICNLYVSILEKQQKGMLQ